MRSVYALFALALLLLPMTAPAHGELFPLRGGLVAWSRELSVELVVIDGNELHVYVDDHGKPVSIAGAKGHVNILRDGDQDTVSLSPDGETKLVGKGSGPKAGDRIQVVVTFPDGRLVYARLSASVDKEPASSAPPAAFARRFDAVSPAPAKD